MIIKGNDDLSHVYIIKRFDKAVLIDPSHSYNDIKNTIDWLSIGLYSIDTWPY